MKKINLAQIFTTFTDYWSPKIVGKINDSLMKVAKFKGTFTWHSHENEDECFLVIKGEMDLEFRDQTVHLKEGEMFVVPRGVEHRPVAKEEVHVLLFEPETVVNTGDKRNEFTKTDFEKLN